MTSKIEIRNSKIENPSQFAAACAWNRFRRWDPQVLERYREDAKQLCALVGVEAVQSGFISPTDIHRLVGWRVREFCEDYGFKRYIERGLRRRADVETRDLEAMVVAPTFRSALSYSELPDISRITLGRVTHQLARNCAAFRARRGLSIKATSRRAQCVKRTIAGIEHETFTPYLATVFSLAHALEVSVDSLVDGIERAPALAWSSYLPFFVDRLERLLRVSSVAPTTLLERVVGDADFLAQTLRNSHGPSLRSVVGLSHELAVRPEFLLKERR